MTEAFTRNPRVVAAAHAIAATESRSGKTSSAVPSAADYHEAVVVVRALDEQLATADGADDSNGVHRITEEGVFDGLWGRQFPTGGRDKWIYLDANAARAIAKCVVAAAKESQVPGEG